MTSDLADNDLVPAGPAGGFVFEPRRVLSTPNLFGKVSVPLEPAAGASQRRARAAQLQHLVSNKVREMLLLRNETLVRYSKGADAEGLSKDRLARIQRGETMMTMTDLLAWCGAFEAVHALVADFLDDVEPADRAAEARPEL